ncbi:hypothetical protein Tco_1316894 [Tanacetum coccineum]
MFHNLDQLRLQLERENLHGVNAKTCLQALRTQFKEFLASKEGIHCISKFPSIYIQLFWNTLTHDAKTGRSLLHDNIIPKLDLALELGKSISLTEAEEEAVAREVHATHARIVSGPDPEPMQEDQTGSNSGKLHVSLAGPNPEHMDDEFLATAYPKVHENLKLITDERVIEENPESHSGSMSSMKNLDDTYNFGDQFLYDKPTEDDQEKSKVVDESDSTIPDPSHQTVTSTPPVIAPFTEFSYPKPSSLVTPPPINTEATTIAQPKLTVNLQMVQMMISLTHMNAIKLFILVQEFKEFKSDEHGSEDVWTKLFRSRTQLDDALLKILERHTADLIEKYSVLPGLESIKNQEYEKSPKEIIRIKKEQGEEKQDSTYSIRPQGKLIVDDDKVDDDDEGPSAGSTGRSGKEKKDPIMPLLALTSPGWAVTDTRDDVNSAMPSI